MNEAVHFIYQTSKEARDRGLLSIWTVYDHPADFPDTYVARRGEVGKGVYGPTNDVVTGDLADIREAMETCGFICTPRADVDPMNIVESWM